MRCQVLILVPVSYSGRYEGTKEQHWDCVETRRQKKAVVSGEWMCHSDAAALQIDLFQQLWRFFAQLCQLAVGPRLSRETNNSLQQDESYSSEYLFWKDFKDAMKVKPLRGTDSLTVFFPAVVVLPSAVFGFGRLPTIYMKKKNITLHYITFIMYFTSQKC